VDLRDWYSYQSLLVPLFIYLQVHSAGIPDTLLSVERGPVGHVKLIAIVPVEGFPQRKQPASPRQIDALNVFSSERALCCSALYMKRVGRHRDDVEARGRAGLRTFVGFQKNSDFQEKSSGHTDLLMLSYSPWYPYQRFRISPMRTARPSSETCYRLFSCRRKESRH
jgi:hypothetical protein